MRLYLWETNMKKQLVPALCALALIQAPFAALAQKPNIAQRHPKATGVVAGVATHSALKRSAAAKKRAHGKLSFAERHPTLTGIAAGVATTKVVKKTTRHTPPTPKK